MFLYFEFSFMAGNLYFLLVSNLWNKFWWHNITRFKIYHQWFIKRFSFPETNWAFNWACLGASFCKFVPWNIPQTHLTNVLKLNRTWNFLISVASFLQLVNIPFSSIIITVLEKKYHLSLHILVMYGNLFLILEKESISCWNLSIAI